MKSDIELIVNAIKHDYNTYAFTVEKYKKEPEVLAAVIQSFAKSVHPNDIHKDELIDMDKEPGPQLKIFVFLEKSGLEYEFISNNRQTITDLFKKSLLGETIETPTFIDTPLNHINTITDMGTMRHFIKNQEPTYNSTHALKHFFKERQNNPDGMQELTQEEMEQVRGGAIDPKTVSAKIFDLRNIGNKNKTYKP